MAEVGQRLIPAMLELVGTLNENKEGIITFIELGVNIAAKAIEILAKRTAFASKNAKILIPILGGLTAAFAAQKIVGIVSGLYALYTAAVGI